jgi:hypothetical protein
VVSGRAPTSEAVYVGFDAALAHAGTVGSVSEAIPPDEILPKSITPSIGLYVLPFKDIPVTVPVFDVFEFQLLISEVLIPAAGEALKIGSDSVND